MAFSVEWRTAPQIGSITASGLLYEGNFDEWAIRMESLLHVHGYKFFRIVKMDKQGNQLLLWHQGVFSLTDAHEAYARVLVLDNVRPGFLTRIPHDRLLEATVLLRCLQKRAKPFQFMELPPASRNRIYKYGFPPEVKLGRDYRLPPVTRVSKQLRWDALALYYSTSRFVLAPEGSDRTAMSLVAYIKSSLGA